MPHGRIGRHAERDPGWRQTAALRPSILRPQERAIAVTQRSPGERGGAERQQCGATIEGRAAPAFFQAAQSRSPSYPPAYEVCVYPLDRIARAAGAAALADSERRAALLLLGGFLVSHFFSRRLVPAGGKTGGRLGGKSARSGSARKRSCRRPPKSCNARPASPPTLRINSRARSRSCAPGSIRCSRATDFPREVYEEISIAHPPDLPAHRRGRGSAAALADGCRASCA